MTVDDSGQPVVVLSQFWVVVQRRVDFFADFFEIHVGLQKKTAAGEVYPSSRRWTEVR